MVRIPVLNNIIMKNIILAIAVIIFWSACDDNIDECGTDIFLTYPVDGEEAFGFKPTFWWNFGDYCGSEFQFQLSEYPYFTELLEDTTVIGDSYTSSLVSAFPQLMYWRIFNVKDSIYLESSFRTTKATAYVKDDYKGEKKTLQPDGTFILENNFIVSLDTTQYGTLQVDSLILIYKGFNKDTVFYASPEVVPHPWHHKMNYYIEEDRIDYCRFSTSSDTCDWSFSGTRD